MSKDPEENTDPISLAEQFRSKGYQCVEEKNDDSTVLIITHPKKKDDSPDHQVILPAGESTSGPIAQA